MISADTMSICICSYNRCQQLEITLASLLEASDILTEGDEIVVINNNSTDQTQQIVDRFASILPISYYFEPKQGLAVARNAALRHSKNDVIVFFDDDVSITTRTLIAYKEAFKHYPKRDYFGGKISIVWPEEKPRWLKSDNLSLLNGLFGFYSLGDLDLVYDGVRSGPYGANFAVRRPMLDLVGDFDESLGVSGVSLGRGEETEYFQRAQGLGCSGLYVAKAEVGHRFQLHRMTVPYLFLYGKEKGRAELILNDGKRDTWLYDYLKFSLKAFYQLLKGRRDRFYQCIINIGIVRGLYLATVQDGEHSA